MAETAVGIHTNDQASEWFQFDFGQSQHDYSPLESDFYASTQLPQYHHQPSSLDFAQDSQAVLFDRQSHAPPSHNHASDFDVADTENKIPLTQDQVAALESSFIAVPKPKTEHKKSLAEKLGLDLRRVNVRIIPVAEGVLGLTRATELVPEPTS